MQPNIIERVWRQDKMVNVDVLNGFTFTDEEEAHRFIISGKNVNTPVDISGTITANFKNANGVLVPLTGTIEDGKAVVVLSRECYAVEGPFSLMIFADTVCIYAAIANAINSSGEVIAYPTATIPSVQELIEEVQDVIASIPQDYSALNQSVQDLKSAVDNTTEYNNLLLNTDVKISSSITTTNYTDADNGVTFTLSSNSNWLWGTTVSGWINRITPGKTYKFRGKCETVSGNPFRKIIIRGTSSSATADAVAFDFTNTDSIETEFVATEYMTEIIFMISNGTALAGTSVKYYDLFIADKESITAIDKTARAEIEEVNDKFENDFGIYGEVTPNVVAGKYISAITNNIETQEYFDMTEPIAVFAGQTITLTATGYNTAVGMIATCNADNTSRSTVVSSIDSTEHTYSYTAKEDGYIVCSYNNGNAHQLTISVDYKKLAGDIQSLAEPPIKYPQMFSNIICMGDSLTVGYTGHENDVARHNYPYYMGKLADAETTIQANGGITTKQYWDSYSGTDYTPYDCAIIYLGTNGGLTDTVSEDCFVDYTQNADTQTGAYGKIIGKIKATAPGCNIFIVAGVNEYFQRDTTMNAAVRDLAEFYGVGLIDIANCILSDNGSGSSAERYLYRPIDGIHYNTLGYMTLANMIYDAMGQFMAEHRTMYATND